MSRWRVGPGFLVAAAFIGPGTIVTASRAGAGYGTTLLWAVLFSVIATVTLQNMAARVGLAGRRGFAEAIRDSVAHPLLRSGVLGLIALTILVGNAAFQTGNLLGASLGISLLTGLPQGLLVGHRGRGGRRGADGRDLQDHPERAGRSRGADERGLLRRRGAERARPGPAPVGVAGAPRAVGGRCSPCSP